MFVFLFNIKERGSAKLNFFFRLFLIYLVLTQFAIIQVKSQTPARLKSTLSSGGLSKNISINSKNCYIQQSIGQQSIIGLNQASQVAMLQGFIQPPLLFSKSKKVDPLLLQATVSPNPFSQSTTIIFSEAINDCIYVNLYDLYGRALYSNKFGSSQEINIDFGNLFSGLYIIKIQSGKKRLVSKLIKE